MNYQETLSFQPILTPNVIKIIEALESGTMTKTQFHNKKAYAKKTSNLVSVLEYSIAFEIVNMKESK